MTTSAKKFILCFVVILGYEVTLTRAQCFRGRSCGILCCPPDDPSQSTDVNGFPRDECCTALSPRSGCCSAQELQTTTCISGRLCPGDSDLDDAGNIRNQCCLYFRDGCCSRGENQDLQSLFNLTIGLSVSAFVVVVATICLLCLCFCCVCH